MLLSFLKSMVYWLSWPFKRLYALVSHKRVEEFALKPISLPATVISVGNITLGGTGKTPTVIWLVRQIRRLMPGIKVGVHLRGYLGEMENVGGVVSDGEHILAGPRDAGDEAFLIARELLDDGIPVGVGKHKADAGFALINQFGLDLLVLDDAFQYTSLNRDLDIVLIDTTRPFGEAGFPREGMMREPLKALERADIVVLTRTELVSGGDLRGIIDKIKPNLKPGSHIFLSSFVPESILAVKTDTEADFELIKARKAVPLSAIGNPRGFERMLEKLGLNLLKPVRFPDHHRFTARDIRYVNKQVLDQGGHIVMVTEKDTVCLGRLVQEIEAPVYTVPIKLEIKDNEGFLKLLNEVLCSTITVKHRREPAAISTGSRVFNVKKDFDHIANEPGTSEPTAANISKSVDASSSDTDWWVSIK